MMKTLTITIGILFSMVNGFSQNIRSVEDANGLAVGSKAPLFIAIDANNKEYYLADNLKNGPVVVIFYRGEWCPICNRHLGNIQDSLTYITQRGATVIAVSPQKPDYLNKMAKKTEARFRFLYDEGYKISDAFDVTFTPTKKQLFVYNTGLNAKLSKSQSDESQRLPIPATYIIDRNGNIVWRQFDSNYKNRSTVKGILENLPE